LRTREFQRPIASLLSENARRELAEHALDDVHVGPAEAVLEDDEERDEHVAVDRAGQTGVEEHPVLALLASQLRVALADRPDHPRMRVRLLFRHGVVECRLVAETRAELRDEHALRDRSLLVRGELVTNGPNE